MHSRPLLSVSFLLVSINTLAQPEYTQFIHNNTKISWAAEYYTVVNLTPVTNTFSLKKYYLDRLRKDSVKAYKVNGRTVESTYYTNDRELQRQPWLKDHYVHPSDHPDRWEFRDRRSTSGYRVSGLSEEKCCGCDEADAFGITQLLVYSEAKFSTRNIFLSPLCARQLVDSKAAWYPLGNFAWNTNPTRPVTSSYLTTRTVTYRIDPFDSIALDILTVGEQGLSALLLKDIKAGRITAHDPESGKKISYEELETWNMPVDTVEIYDTDGNPAGYKVVQAILDPRELVALRLEHDWYFDLKTERLYSEVKSGWLMKNYRSMDGTVIGSAPYIRLKFR